MAKAHTRDDNPRSTKHKKGAKTAAQNGKVKHGKPSSTASKKLLLPPRADWHAAELPRIPTPSSLRPVPTQLLDKVHAYAISLYETEASTYTATHLKADSSYKFMSTIMSSGTWTDKVSALTLVVQESPLHTLKPFENLVVLAGKRSRTQALLALESLKDMLSQGHVLPPNRKLRMFNKQPELLAALQGVSTSWVEGDPLPDNLTPQHLIFWVYEDQLKAKYFDILKIMESWCNDEVEFARVRSVTFISELLREKPEQEENLLRLLVNKLGDNSKKVASRASYLLLQLQITHPSMKTIIINAIESDILLRPGQNLNAKYYAVITLNQTVLQSSDPSVANKLLDVYFSLFITILNRSRKVEPKPLDDAKDDATKKRKRISKINDPDATGPEQELEDKIVAQVLTGINRAFPFSGKESEVFEKHLDTMFRITHSANFNTSIQALMLIQQISSSHNISTDRFLRTLYESLLDPRLVRSSKHTMYLNLLYRSLKSDVSIRRVKAFVKRLLQIMELHEPPFVCALLYLVIELQNLFPGIKAMLEQPEMEEDDEEEVFADVPDEDDGARHNAAEKSSTVSSKHLPTNAPYDGRKRDPEYSNADRTCLWELSPWTRHYHPSVTVFASYLASATPRTSAGSRVTTNIPAKPDPASHSLIHFLDRFVYRNARTSSKHGADAGLRGTSLMQPALAAHTTDSLLLGRTGAGVGGETSSLNSEAFWSKRAEDVAPDEVFFHRYFAEVGPKRKAEAGGKSKGKNADEERDVKDADGGEEFGEEDEDEIWRALVMSSKGKDGLDDDGDADEDEEEDDVEDDEMFDYDHDDDEGEGDEGDEADSGVDIEGGLSDIDLEDADGDEDIEIKKSSKRATLGKHEDEDSDAAFNLEDDSGSALFSSEDEQELPVAVPQLPGDNESQEGESKRKRRRKLKDLPTFASADDYAELIARGDADGEEEG